MHNLYEPALVIAIGIAGAIGFACIGFLTTALIFALVAIGGAFEYTATLRFNEQQAGEGFEG